MAEPVEIIYIGPHEEVEVPAANLIAAKGKPVSVKASVAKSLLQQEDNWREAYPTPKKTAAKKAAVKPAADESDTEDNKE